METNTAWLSSRALKTIKLHLSDQFKVPPRELPRVFFHGFILACIVCGFWLMDSVKDPILNSTIGIEYQPFAKLFSVFTTLIVVCAYDYLTSVVSKATLFHVVALFFGLIMIIISALLTDPVAGLGNTNVGPHRFLGWFSYFIIEAYGSLMVALFWSFTNSLMDLEQAKGTYGLIISIAQFGAIGGSTMAANAQHIGMSRLAFMGGVLIFCVSLLVKVYHITYQDHKTKSTSERVRSASEDSSISLLTTPTVNMHGRVDSIDIIDNTEELTFAQRFKRAVHLLCTGFYEGFSLILRYPYILKILGISCLYEIVVTVLDYQFKMLGAESVADSINKFASEATDTDLTESSMKFSNLLGHFGQVTNLISFFVSFFGFSFLVHKLGVQKCLMIFPTVMFLAVVITNLVPQLWVLFLFVSVIKAMIFSLHDPVKELLYIPTSEPIKYKAKAWIDVFGARLAKAAGSLLTSLARGDPSRLRLISEIPCLIIASLIVLLAFSVGRDFQNLVDSNVTVGDEQLYVEHHLLDGIQMGKPSSSSSSALPERNGRRPGDVGYDGYDLHLFDGVFEEEEDDNEMKIGHTVGVGQEGEGGGSDSDSVRSDMGRGGGGRSVASVSGLTTAAVVGHTLQANRIRAQSAQL